MGLIASWTCQINFSYLITGFPLRRVFVDLSQDLCQVEWEMFFRRLRGGKSHITITGFPLRRVFVDLSQDLCQVEWEMFFRRLRGGKSHITITGFPLRRVPTPPDISPD